MGGGEVAAAGDSELFDSLIARPSLKRVEKQHCRHKLETAFMSMNLGFLR